MKVLVTGSAGHLGEALVRSLSGLGEEVIGLDILQSPFTACLGSIADRACVRRCMSGVRRVFHAATLHKPMSQPTAGRISSTRTSPAR